MPQTRAPVTIRVLLAGGALDMHSHLVEATAASDDIELIGPVFGQDEIVDAVVSGKPQVVILDLTIATTLAEIADLVADIREKSPESKILVSSAITVDRMVRYLVRLGISGYVFENIDGRALLLAIRTVASGGTIFSEAILRR